MALELRCARERRYCPATRRILGFSGLYSILFGRRLIVQPYQTAAIVMGRERPDAEQTKTGDMLSVERLRIGTHMNIIRNTIYLYDVPVFSIFQMSSETSGPHRILTSGSGRRRLRPAIAR